MRRYFYQDKSELSIDEEIKISGDLFKHIFIVCRRKEGDGFELLTKDSSAYFVRVTEVSKSEAKVKIKERREIEPLKKPYVHLVLSNPKPAVFERVIEKSVELGVYSVYPLITENSFFKTATKLKEKKKRLEKIALHARQQAGSGHSLIINDVLKTSEFFQNLNLKEIKAWSGFILYEAMGDHMAISEIKKQSVEVSDVYLVVGAEGGFNPSEVDLFKETGFKSISLGNQILRVETACVAGISILKSRLGLWS